MARARADHRVGGVRGVLVPGAGAADLVEEPEQPPQFLRGAVVVLALAAYRLVGTVAVRAHLTAGYRFHRLLGLHLGLRHLVLAYPVLLRPVPAHHLLLPPGLLAD